MENSSFYILVICLIVFILLVGAFSIWLILFIRNSLKLIKIGAEDDKLIEEYKKSKLQKKLGFIDILNNIVTTVFSVALILALAIAIYSNVSSNNVVGSVPAIKAVLSNSMSYKNSSNTYLIDNELNNQIQTHDLVVLRQLPDEFQLKKYDIVLYERDGLFILHRIIDIDEPNDSHPGKRLFAFQGDAVPNKDNKPVEYSQMKGIYLNERIPHIGSFVHFMQSPAGYLCLVLVVFVIITTPILDKHITNAKFKRLKELSEIDADELYYKLKSLKKVEEEESKPKPKGKQMEDTKAMHKKLDKLLEEIWEMEEQEQKSNKKH